MVHQRESNQNTTNISKLEFSQWEPSLKHVITEMRVIMRLQCTLKIHNLLISWQHQNHFHLLYQTFGIHYQIIILPFQLCLLYKRSQSSSFVHTITCKSCVTYGHSQNLSIFFKHFKHRRHHHHHHRHRHNLF